MRPPKSWACSSNQLSRLSSPFVLLRNLKPSRKRQTDKQWRQFFFHETNDIISDFVFFFFVLDKDFAIV